MKKIIVGLLLLSILLAPLDLYIQKQLHEWGQKSEFGNSVVMGLDLMAFTKMVVEYGVQAPIITVTIMRKLPRTPIDRPGIKLSFGKIRTT